MLRTVVGVEDALLRSGRFSLPGREFRQGDLGRPGGVRQRYGRRLGRRSRGGQGERGQRGEEEADAGGVHTRESTGGALRVR